MTSRLLTTLALIYTALVFYSSLMPWDLDGAWAAVAERLAEVARTIPFDSEIHVSKIDMVSNFVLYVPLGFLVASRSSLGRQRSLRRTLIAALSWGALLSLGVEAMQLFLPSRQTDLHDLLINSAGALAGGAVGWTCGRKIWIGLRRRASREVSEHPVSIAAVLMMFLLTADALFPFHPSLDVSTVMKSIRLTQEHGLVRGFGQHPWFHWLVLEVGVYAALAALLAAWLDARGDRRWWRGGVWAFVFAVAIELGKTLIVQRFTNAANLVAAGVGCTLGLFCFARLRGRLSDRARLLLAGVLLTGLVVYLEWEPFDFIWDPATMRSEIPSGAAWLPLYHYAISGRGEKVFLFTRTITLLAALTCSWQLAHRAVQSGPLRAALLAGGFGLGLELGQFLLPGRVPSVTDVLCFAAGGALGSLCAAAWRKHRQRQGVSLQLPQRRST